ncbi:hypothetical protein ABZ671_00505 [Micromonospora sp. NPDC006766]|uniref:hypothetical protein n=1 Tax=Micromonospora sp. NPDC006766 TaxID=3154778 RepID=UPI0033DA7449
MTADDRYLTVRDGRGASLVLERDDDGSLSAWIAPPGGNDGPSVFLDKETRAQVAAFLTEGKSEETQAEVIAARRKHIQDTARCVGCGGTLTDCKANRGKDPNAPAWFGCCARGTALGPCRHEVDAGALLALLGEIEAGEVRSVEQVTEEDRRSRAARTGMSWFDYLNQDKVWQPKGKPPVAIADMDPEWRYNAARWLESGCVKIGHRYSFDARAWLLVQLSSPLGPSENAADAIEGDIDRETAEIKHDPVAWIRTTALYRALVAGLPTKPKKLTALAERARHWSTCPARNGDANCRCEQIRAANDERETAQPADADGVA